MAIDDNKLIFKSDWDTDQLIRQGTAVVTVTDSDYEARKLVVDYTSLGLTAPPMHMINSRVQGQTKWVMQGASPAYDGSTHAPIFPAATSQKLNVYGGDVGTTYEIRYYIFKKSAQAT